MKTPPFTSVGEACREYQEIRNRRIRTESLLTGLRKREEELNAAILLWLGAKALGYDDADAFERLLDKKEAAK